MEWWHWVLVVAVAFASFTWWISRLPGKRGNEEDFRAVTDTYLRKAAEYYEMADRANSLSSLRQIEKKLVVLAGDYIDMGKRFDLSQSQTAIDGNKAMSRIVHAVSTAVEGNEGALVTGRRGKRICASRDDQATEARECSL